MPTIWMPDHPPETASAYDDEFADASLDTGLWTEWDQASTLTVSEGEHGLDLSQTTSVSHQVAGIYQAIPAGDWAIWTRVSPLTTAAADLFKAGMLLGQDLAGAAATSDAYLFSLSWSSTTGYRIAVDKYDQYNTYGSLLGLVSVSDVFATTHIYFRVRKASTTYSWDWSSDGLGWQVLYSGTLAFTPAHMGLAVSNVTAATYRAVFGFFRYAAGTPAITDIMLGRRADPESPYASSSGLPFTLMQGRGFGFRRGAPIVGVR